MLMNMFWYTWVGLDGAAKATWVSSGFFFLLCWWSSRKKMRLSRTRRRARVTMTIIIMVLRGRTSLIPSSKALEAFKGTGCGKGR